MKYYEKVQLFATKTSTTMVQWKDQTTLVGRQIKLVIASRQCDLSAHLTGLLHLSCAGGLLHTGISFLTVPVCYAKLTNQCKGKQCVEIFASIGALFGHKAEASFMDFFLEQKVTNVQSALLSLPMTEPFLM